MTERGFTVIVDGAEPDALGALTALRNASGYVVPRARVRRHPEVAARFVACSHAGNRLLARRVTAGSDGTIDTLLSGSEAGPALFLMGERRSRRLSAGIQMGSVLDVRALAGASLPQLLISSHEDGFLFVGAVALDVGPHEVKELARSGYFLALADCPEREPCVQWHAETLDRRLGWRGFCCHIRNRTATGLRWHKTRATVVT